MNFVDANGNEWTTAEEALADFLGELPDLTPEETEMVFQFTRYNYPAERNLTAIEYGITYAGLDARFAGDNYPVPQYAPTTEVVMSRHRYVREHSTFTAQVPVHWLKDGRYFEEDGTPTSDFDQWMCDNGTESNVAHDEADEEGLSYEIERIDVGFMDNPDTTSSGSRQHYIDTGRYLTHREVAEHKALNPKEA
jgi:hypothetical protein